MSEQVLYDETCSTVKVSWTENLEPVDRVPFVESPKKYFTFNAENRESGIKVTIEFLPGGGFYEGFTIRHFGIYSNTVYDNNGNSTTTTEPQDSIAFSNLRYKNRVLYDDPNGEFTAYDYYKYQYGWIEDENGNITEGETVYPAPRLTLTTFAQDFNNENSAISSERSLTHIKSSLLTYDRRPIDPDTGEILPCYKIRVYNTGVSEYEFDSLIFLENPIGITIECLNLECEADCVPLWNADFTARICLCESTGDPTTENVTPNLDLESNTWAVP